MYVIRLKNCAFFARHGLHPEEERLGQRFYVDAELTVRPRQPLEEDSIDGTVDYGAVFAEIERIVTGTRRRLIETLAQDVAQALCARFAGLERVVITIRKPGAPIAGVLDHVEVTLAWPE